MSESREREEFLIGLNQRWLQQGTTLLDQMKDETYRRSVPDVAGQRIGPQVRHVIEFYESFFNGIERRSIDYDAREREPLLETSRLAAAARLRRIQTRLVSFATPGDCCVLVRVEDSPGGAFVTSTVARELQALSSHTVHHFALVAMLARMLDVDVDPELGVAPSTLSYWQQMASAAQCVQ